MARRRPAPLLRAARVGGVSTSTTAAAAMGLRTPPDPRPDAAEGERLHVASRRTTTRLHDPDEGGPPLRRTPAIVLHRTAPEVVDAAVPAGIAPPLVMLGHAIHSLPPEHALAVPDSALHHRFVRAGDLPARLRPVVVAADGRADSGIETIPR